MSEDNNGHKHDDLGRLADIVTDVRADEPSEAQWERARHNLTARLESHRLETLSGASVEDQSDTRTRPGRMSIRRKLVVGIGAACALAAGIVIGVVFFQEREVAVVPPEVRPALPAHVGKVENANGQCLRVADGRSPSTLTSGDELLPGDRVTVGPTGALQLGLADGSTLWLRPGTDVECVGPRSATSEVVRLYRGEFRADITRDPNAPFRIWTPAGSLKVLGTEFDVRVVPDITQEESEEGEMMRRLRSTLRRAILVVSVLSGSVAVEADGNEQVVAGGQRTLVAANSAAGSSEEIQNVAYLRTFDTWLKQPAKEAKAESLAFVPVRENLLHSLVAVDADSGETRRIADFVGCVPRVVRQFGPDLAIVNASSVLFAFFGDQPISDKGGPLVNDPVLLVNLTTGEKLPIVPLKDSDPLYMQLSPDCRKLAFVGNRNVEDSKEREFGLFVLDLETFKLKLLLSGALKTASHWSPDSRWLAVSKSPGYTSNHQIVLVDVMTGAVTETDLKGAGVHFSPDGKQLVYSSDFKKSGSWSAGVPTWGNLFVAGVQERQPKQITELPEGGALQPSFSPDGSRLLYWQASKDNSEPDQLHEIDMLSGKDRVVAEGRRFGSLRWLDANSRVLLSFTESSNGGQSAKLKLVDLAGERPGVREVTSKAERASPLEPDEDSVRPDRLLEVFTIYRDAVKAQDLHQFEQSQAKYAEARDLAKIIDELEALGPLQKEDLVPYLQCFQDEADVSQDERMTQIVRRNLEIVGFLLRIYLSKMGQLPLKGGEQLEPLKVDPKMDRIDR